MGNKVILLVWCPSSHVASRGLRNFLFNDFQLYVQELRLQARFFKGLLVTILFILLEILKYLNSDFHRNLTHSVIRMVSSSVKSIYWNDFIRFLVMSFILMSFKFGIYTLLATKVVAPPLKTIKLMWIELLCFHLAEIGMIWTRDCSPTKSDTTLGRHSMQGQVGSSSPETTV